MNAQERWDLMETRTKMAKDILDVLLIAMGDDCPPSRDVEINVIWAATELLSVPEVVE